MFQEKNLKMIFFFSFHFVSMQTIDESHMLIVTSRLGRVVTIMKVGVFLLALESLGVVLYECFCVLPGKECCRTGGRLQ